MRLSIFSSFCLLRFAFSFPLMVTIHIARNQKSLGAFSEEEVRQGIRSGRFSSEDLVWRVGMETWKPLGEMAILWGLNQTPPPLYDAATTASETIASAERDGNAPAWEERETVGLFPSITQTVSAVLMHPTETFAKMKHSGGLTSPLLYFVFLSTVTGAVSALYQMLSSSTAESMMTQLHQLAPNLSTYPLKIDRFVMIGSLLLSPALHVIVAFLSSGITHLSLKLVGGAHRPFETTFRVICYSMASAGVFSLLPFCGGLIGLLWASYTIIIGLKEAHGTSAWKTTLAVILPDLICCFLPALLLIGGITAAYLAKTGLPQ